MKLAKLQRRVSEGPPRRRQHARIVTGRCAEVPIALRVDLPIRRKRIQVRYAVASGQPEARVPSRVRPTQARAPAGSRARVTA